MTLDELLKSWEKDAVLDQLDPGKDLIRIPILHSKYLTEMMQHKMKFKKANFEFSKMKKLKSKFYSGKMSKEELEDLGWQPHGFILKGDVDLYVDGDDEVIKVQERLVYHEEAVKACEYILKELGQRTWALKEYITWQRFIAGA